MSKDLTHWHVLLINDGQFLCCVLLPSRTWPTINHIIISCISSIIAIMMEKRTIIVLIRYAGHKHQDHHQWKLPMISESESESDDYYSSSSSAMVLGLHRLHGTSSGVVSMFQLLQLLFWYFSCCSCSSNIPAAAAALLSTTAAVRNGPLKPDPILSLRW